MDKELQRLSTSTSVDCCGSPVEVGQWFMASYGFSHVIGRCVDILPQGLVLKFRWGGPFRERKFVRYDSILGRVSDPRWIKIY